MQRRDARARAFARGAAAVPARGVERLQAGAAGGRDRRRADEVAAVLDALWGGPETLIVISSDLSHYHPYDEARAIDARTVQAILDFRTDIDHDAGVRRYAGAGFLGRPSAAGCTPELLDARNSGDTAGGRDRVVGYASFAFWEERRRLRGRARPDAARPRARGRRRTRCGRARAAAIPDAVAAGAPRNLRDAAAGRELRGCIGSLKPTPRARRRRRRERRGGGARRPAVHAARPRTTLRG